MEVPGIFVFDPIWPSDQAFDSPERRCAPIRLVENISNILGGGLDAGAVYRAEDANLGEQLDESDGTCCYPKHLGHLKDIWVKLL